MTTLIERIQQINAANQAWMQEDPANRYAGYIITDLDHWLDLGVKTAEDFDQYLDECVARNTEKSDMVGFDTY